MTDFSRSTALLGDAAMSRLKAAHVAVVGVGGVGSWCAEALVRTGVGRITIMDDDVVAPSNVNRQCPALATTLALPKVEAMRERLLAINPDCEVVALNARYGQSRRRGVPASSDEESVSSSDEARTPRLRDFTLVVDAIDSVDCKAELILNATEADLPIVSSMGAALRLDPTKVVVKRFDKVAGDGLARALRQRFKKLGRFPRAKFLCICSEETPLILEDRMAKGSMMPVTCAFGMALAATVIKELTKDA